MHYIQAYLLAKAAKLYYSQKRQEAIVELYEAERAFEEWQKVNPPDTPNMHGENIKGIQFVISELEANYQLTIEALSQVSRLPVEELLAQNP